MLRTAIRPALLAVALLTVASSANAQILSVTPRAGVFTSSGSQAEAAGEVYRAVSQKSAALALGATLDVDLPFSPFDLRVGVDYAPGSVISANGISDEAERSMLGVSGDLVFRPIPRLLVVQPYVMGGIGYIRQDLKASSRDLQTLFDGTSSYKLHAGAGIGLNLGSIGADIQVSDYLSRPKGEPGFLDLEHAVFATLGVRVGLF